MGNSNYFNKHYEPDTTIVRMCSSGVKSPVRVDESNRSQSNLVYRDTDYSKQSVMYRLSDDSAEASSPVQSRSGVASVDRVAPTNEMAGVEQTVSKLEQVLEDDDNSSDHELKAEDVDD